MAELRFLEIDGNYTPCDGTWRQTIVANPSTGPIHIKLAEVALAIDNGCLADISVYLLKPGNKQIVAQGFPIQTATNFPLVHQVSFGHDWITLLSSDNLTLSYIGYPNVSPARSFIPVGRIYYTVSTS